MIPQVPTDNWRDQKNNYIDRNYSLCMSKMKPAAVCLSIFLVTAVVLPLAYPASSSCLQNPSTCMQGSMSGKMCPKMSSPQTSRSVPASPCENNKMPPYCQSVFQSDIIRSLQGFRIIVRRRVSGIRQIASHNVLNNESRKRILDLIHMNPGIDPTEISSLTGLNKQTLRYHLGILTSFHKIEVVLEGGCFHYFKNCGATSALERKIAIHMRNAPTRNIVEIIGKRPGINQVEIAGLLKVTPPTVVWYIRKLIRDGLVLEERQGKTVHYDLSTEVKGILGAF
jgi:predicted transcriptional regulator